MFSVCIYNLEERLFEDWVESVRLPVPSGEFEVMGCHVPFIAVLSAGLVWLDRRVLKVRKGLAWLAANRLVLLIE